MTEATVRDRKYYEYDPDANSFAGVEFDFGGEECVDDDDTHGARVTEIHWIDTPIRDSWSVLSCYGFDDNPPEQGDFPSMSNYRKIPMMSERAWKLLKPLIGECCEALPVRHPFKGNYFIIHVMRTIDALDETKIEASRSSVGDNRISRIYKYAFKRDLIGDAHIFKLPLMSGSGLFVDDVFREAVEANGLRGLRFRELVMAE
jgi:hypothetical protein